MSITLWQPINFGDTPGDLGDHADAAAENTSINTNLGPQTFVGDALALIGHADGGDDTLGSGGMAPITIIGDAIMITDHARGGNDHIDAVAKAGGIGVGDAVTLSGHARGGDDTIFAAASHIGLNGGAAYGDAQTIIDHARGGDDVVGVGLGGTAYGDAQTLSDFAVGGNDTLIGLEGVLPGGLAKMYGDGAELFDHSKGGNDTLTSGSYANEQMWGDAAVVAPTAQTGADTFVFSPHNGQDQIMDFQAGKDHIELKDFGFTDFSDVAGHVHDTPDGALITFDTISYGHDDSILVAGIHQLNASDFILA